MGDESSDELKLISTIKKLTFQLFLFFSSDIVEKDFISFLQSVVFLL